MNIIDKAIAFISPEWGYLRSVFRDAIERGYDAGEINRFNDSWIPINQDTEEMDRTERDIIKARARSLERNSDIANSAVGAIVRNVIGTGIKPQARIKNKSGNSDDKNNALIEKAWKTWIKAQNCDITGQQTFYEIQAMALNRKIYDGEILIRKVFDKSATIPLKLQVLKSDLLDTYMMYAPGTNNVIRGGIELDQYLKPVAYWIQRKSPDGYVTLESERVPADQIIHLWTKKHSDQIRGISELAVAIKRIKDTGDYLEAETVAARIAACFSIFIKKILPNTGLGRPTDKDGKQLRKIVPGMIHELRPGEEIQTANPSRSITTAKDYVGIQQRLAGSGIGLSYEIISRDFSGATFSSARQGHLEDRRLFEPMQLYSIDHLCQPVWEAFVEACVLAGIVTLPNYFTERDRYHECEWITPGWDWIDPVKEVSADILALKTGGKTLAQWCAERGYDWQDQLKQMAAEKEFAESMGLTLDIHKPEAVQAAEMNLKGELNGKQNEE